MIHKKEEPSLLSFGITKEIQGKQKEDSSSNEQSPKKFEKGLFDTPQNSASWKIDKVLILKTIEELSPCSLGDLTRALPYSRSSIYYAVKGFENCGLVKTSMQPFENGIRRIITFLAKQKESSGEAKPLLEPEKEAK